MPRVAAAASERHSRRFPADTRRKGPGQAASPSTPPGPDVVPFAAKLAAVVGAAAIQQQLLCGRELDLPTAADIVSNQVLQTIENGGREHVHAEMAEKLVWWQPWCHQMLHGVNYRWLFFDRGHGVQPPVGIRYEQPSNRAKQMQMR